MFPTQVTGDDESMPYKDPIKQREASQKLMANYRERQRGACHSLYQKEKNRLGFLELEVERLQKCLEVAQRGCTMP